MISRHVQRREPHRRSGRPGHRHLGDGVRLVHPHRHLAVRQRCVDAGAGRASCYEVRDPLDLAVVAAALMGACFGFLWWNASPAKIFMGDTGSLALGGALAGLAIFTRTELLLAARRPVRPDHAVGDHPGRLLQAHRQAGLPDGAAAAPLRAGRAGREVTIVGPVLDHRRAVRRRRARRLLRRVGRRREAIDLASGTPRLPSPGWA